MRTKTFAVLTIAAALTLSACSQAEEVPVDKVEQTTPAAASHSHARGDGTIASIQGVSIDMVEADLIAGRETNVQFTLSRIGEPIMDYVVNHDFPVHAVLVDERLDSFQHLHPAMGKNGVWQLPVTFPAAGNYRIITDFTVLEGNEEVNYVVGTDLVVTGAAPAAFTLPEPVETVTLDGFVATVSGSVSATEHSSLMFTVTKDGVPVTFENWLGASAHLVAIRQGDRAFAHMHPQGHDHSAPAGDMADPDAATMGDMESTMADMPGMVHFDAEFPAGAGTYRLFLQFQVDGKLHTIPFTAVVA
jgi:hypothetical protein